MSIEEVQKELASFVAQREEALQKVYMFDGAIQVCEYFLTKLNQIQPPAPPPALPPVTLGDPQ